MVLNLVDLLRYEIKEEQFDPQPIHINRLLTEIQKKISLEPLAVRRVQELRIHPCPEQTIVADYIGLKRVLYNLVNNAIQHLGKGNHIDVAVQPEENEFLFTVQDDGPGISPEVQQKLFQRFNKGKGKAMPHGSSGLGLYITKDT